MPSLGSSALSALLSCVLVLASAACRPESNRASGPSAVAPSPELCARYRARADASPAFQESAEYCQVVKDGCCVAPTSTFPRWSWNCNNADYIDWFANGCAAR